MSVPLLVTLDLEIARDHDLIRQSTVLDDLRRDLERLALPITLFTTADAAEAYRKPLRRLAESGHEVACHGTDHTAADDYRNMPYEEASRRIASARVRIEAATGVRPRAFRGPRMRTSVATQRALAEQGFCTDLSACPQRIDYWRSGAGLLDTLRSPRAPYFPSTRSTHERGNAPILCVPLSGLGVPFVSGTLYLLGLPLMTALFRLLLFEARRRGSAIVYLLHSYEFASFVDLPGDRRPVHQRLYVRDPALRYRRNLQLLRRMTRARDVAPTTASDFARAHGETVAVPGPPAPVTAPRPVEGAVAFRRSDP